ncbi:MAG: hypothetical protein QOG87_1601 [Actinomycetota bacterium]
MATYEQTRVVVPVVVAGIPVERFLELHAHLDALLGELAVLAVPGTPTPPVLEEMEPLFDGLTGPFAAARRSTKAAARRARDSGDTEFTLGTELPLYAVVWIAEWNRLLDGADAASSRGLLLTPPAPPDVVELRRWIGGEVAAQLTKVAS